MINWWQVRSLFETEQIAHYYERSDIEFYDFFCTRRGDRYVINHQTLKVTHKFGLQINILLC